MSIFDVTHRKLALGAVLSFVFALILVAAMSVHPSQAVASARVTTAVALSEDAESVDSWWNPCSWGRFSNTKFCGTVVKIVSCAKCVITSAPQDWEMCPCGW